MDVRLDDISGEFRIIDENGEIRSYNLHDELRINEANLAQEFLQQPSKYLYWGSVLEKVNMYLDSAKWKLEVLEANLRDEARIFFTQKNVKSNAQMIDDYAKKNQSWQDQRAQITNLEFIVKQTKLIVRSFEQRKDMLQSYGAQIRNDINYGNGAGNVPSSYR